MYVVADNCILEKDTGNKIYIQDTKDLNLVARKLNLGSGFQGFTPNFFSMCLQPDIINNTYTDLEINAGITCRPLSNT